MVVNNSFSLLKEYYHYRDAVMRLIDKYEGMYTMAGFADREFYRCQFDDALYCENFRNEIRQLVPGAYSS